MYIFSKNQYTCSKEILKFCQQIDVVPSCQKVQNLSKKNSIEQDHVKGTFIDNFNF